MGHPTKNKWHVVIDFIDRRLDNYVYKEEERNAFQVVAKFLNILKYREPHFMHNTLFCGFFLMIIIMFSLHAYFL